MRHAMVGYLFAGQGSQYVGMGKDLYDTFPESKSIFDTADKVLGMPLSRLCFEGPAQELTRTSNCQPAIFTVSIAALQAFSRVVGKEAPAVRYTAGLSLGEYSALVAAGAISFQDALYLLRCRGKFMEEEAMKSPGTMASLIGLDLAAVKKICLETNTEIANINSPEQIVISGKVKDIEQALGVAQNAGAKRAILLDVSGAFHSSLMKEASVRLAKELEKITIKDPAIPIISNVNAREARSAREIKENLISQVTASVRWDESMRLMLSKGVIQFIEFGPGKVLKGLMRRIDSNARVANIEKKEDILTFKETSNERG